MVATHSKEGNYDFASRLKRDLLSKKIICSQRTQIIFF